MKRRGVRVMLAAVLMLAVMALVAYSADLMGQNSVQKVSAGTSLYQKPAAVRDYWPTKEWRVKKPGDAGLDPKALAKMEAYAFVARTVPEAERKGIRTDSVLVIKNGYLVYEKYAGGFTRDMVHLTWSDSKSFTNALFGIAVKEGRIKLDDPAWKYYPSLNRGRHKTITVDHLLRMSSGLYSNETYEASPFKSTVNAMLFTTGHRDMAAYAASQDFEADPGSKWEYASPTPNLLMAMLKNTMGRGEYDRYPWDKLFNVIGVKKAVWERDAAGTFVGSSYAYTTPRDMARFGYLFLNDGVWDGKRILPAGWVRYSTALAPAYCKTELKGRELEDPAYGALWWLNRDVPEVNKKRVYPDAPEDTFMAMGHWGQFIFVIPSLDMVVVYTGDNRDKTFKVNTFLKLIIDGMKKR